MSLVKWEKKRFKDCTVFRTKVAGGWLVWVNDRRSGGVNFYSDPSHKWNLSNGEFFRMEKE